MLRRAYDLDWERSNPISGINFPDIVKLGPGDRDYDAWLKNYSSEKRKIPEKEFFISR